MEQSKVDEINNDMIYCLDNNASADVIQAIARVMMKYSPGDRKEAVERGKIVSIDDDKDLKYIAFGEDSQKGFSVKWQYLIDKIKFRTDELSLFTGINGHGKSMFISHLALDLIDSGAVVMMCSMEMRLKYLFRRLMRQVTAMPTPSFEYINHIEKTYAKRLFFLNHLGSISGQLLIDTMEDACKLYGCNVFVIDSLMKCGLGEDDYNEQKKFVDMLCDFKSKNDVHIILVAHPRKGVGEQIEPGKMDVKGTGTITDLADNCFSIWRNKKKENIKEDFERKHLPIPDDLIGEADAYFYCMKQRNGDWEGRVPLWYNKDCMQYLSYHSQKPHVYVNYSRNMEITKEKEVKDDEIYPILEIQTPYP